MSVPIVPCLWFPDCAEEAMEFYCSVFPDSLILSIERYPDESLDEHFEGMSGKVISGRFVLGELMTGPVPTQALMRMKKIVVDDLVNAG